MAASTVIKHYTDGTITLTDGAGTPATLTVPFTNGDLEISGLSADPNEINAYETRGTLHSLRKGKRKYPQVSFTAMIADYSDATDQTLLDMILRQGSFASAVSTRGANADVYTLNLKLTVEGTDYGDAADHEVTVNDVAWEISISEGEPNTVKLTGTVYGAVSMT